MREICAQANAARAEAAGARAEAERQRAALACAEGAVAEKLAAAEKRWQEEVNGATAAASARAAEMFRKLRSP